MIVYWTMFLAPAFGALGETERRGRRFNAALFTLLTFMFLVIAFRETGGDWPTYSRVFDRISMSELPDAVRITDPAYGALNWASSQLGLGLYGVNVACAIVFLAAFWRFCSLEPRPLLMLTVASSYLIIVVVMGYTRQGTAIGLELLALRALTKRRLAGFIGWTLAAATFHSTAAILLPLAYFAVPKQGMQKWWRRALALATIAVALGIMQSELSSKADLFVSAYIESSHYQSQGAVVRNAMSLAAAVTLFSVRRKWASVWGDQDIWLAFSLAALALVGLSFFASTAADRIGLYVIPLQIIVFARLPSLMPRPLTRMAIVSVVTAYAAALGIWLHFGQFATVLWLPYRSLLFGEV